MPTMPWARIRVALADDKLALTTDSFDTELRRYVDKAGTTTYVMFVWPLAGVPLDFKSDDARQADHCPDEPPDTFSFKRK